MSEHYEAILKTDTREGLGAGDAKKSHQRQHHIPPCFEGLGHLPNQEPPDITGWWNFTPWKGQ